MIFEETTLAGSFIITIPRAGDSRGWFARTYCADEFSNLGINTNWVQANHSFSTMKGTLRGMHYQKHPYGEIKMVRCISGSVYDVIIDLRKDSPTFLQWFGVELSVENMKMLYIPKGFAHGFQTLTANAELIYQHSEFYTPEAEAGIHYDDKLINIGWPLPVAVISERDKTHPKLLLTFKGL